MKTLVFLLIFVISPFVFSNELIIGDNIRVLAMDGVKTKNSFFNNNSIQVTEGSHQIVVRYVKKFKKKGLVESKPYIFNIEVKGTTLLKTGNYSNYTRIAKQLKNGLTWQIKNKQKEYTIEKTAELQGKGFMPYSNIELLIKEYNKKNDPNKTTINDELTNNHLPENYLIEEYKKATQKQKEHFKAWFNKQ